MLHEAGINGLIIATFTAGIMLIIMGRAGLGSLIKFIAYPVIAGARLYMKDKDSLALWAFE